MCPALWLWLCSCCWLACITDKQSRVTTLVSLSLYKSCPGSLWPDRYCAAHSPAPTLCGPQPDPRGQNKSLPTLQFSLESRSSGKSSLSLVRGVRLSSSGPPLLTGLVSLDLPLDPLWEFPRDRYTEQAKNGGASSRVVPTDLRPGSSWSPGWCSESPWVRAVLGKWFVQKPSVWIPPGLTKPAPWL